jgi:hypothetical protein
VSRPINWHTAGCHRGCLGAVHALLLQTGSRLLAVGRIALSVCLWLRTEITGVDERLFAGARAESLLDKRLVCAKSGLKLRRGDVVEELAFTELAIGDGEPLLAISRLPILISSIFSG